MKNISIYVSYHQKCDLVKTKIFKPIQVGTVLKSPCYPGELNDATGDNISEKNKSFCELTAQYWAWKNDKTSDYIGFYHYRRHLILNQNNDKVSNKYGVVDYPCVDDDYLRDTGYFDAYVSRFLPNIDVIVPEKWDVRKLYAKNNLDQYKGGDNLYIEDYYECLSILDNKYPEYSEAAREYNTSYEGYYTNMFIMKRKIFMHYSAWLFDILFELEKRLDLSNRDAQEFRVFGYLSEWLLGIYVTKLIEDKKYNIVHCRRAFIEHTNTNNYSLSPINTMKSIAIEQDSQWIQQIEKKYKVIVPLVTAFNENYAITGATMLQSIIENSNDEFFYDLYIIEGALSDNTKLNLHVMIKKHANFRLNIVNADCHFEGKELGLHSHFSKETYYRVLIPRLLPQYNKVLYLDADLVVNKDVQYLFSIDIGNNYIGAVKDYVMAGFVKQKVMCRGECGQFTTKEYLERYLGLKKPSDYAQAGVLILNTKQISENKIDDLILDEMSKRHYWFLDQDLLNKYCEGHIYYLDMRWNVLHGNGNVDSFFKKLPVLIADQYFAARKDPWVIHYAGDKKPWLYKDIDFAQIFFFYLQKTPWGLTTIKTEAPPPQYIHQEPIIHYQPHQMTIRGVLKPFVDRLLPAGTVRRNIMYKVYVKIASIL